MPLPRYRGKIRQVFGNSSFYDIPIALAACVIAYFSAVGLSSVQPPPNNHSQNVNGIKVKRAKATINLYIFVPALFIAFASLAKGAIKLYDDLAKDSPQEIEGCLYAILGLLTAEADKPNPRVRLTLHVAVEKGGRIEQLIDYVGDSRTPKTSGRTFETHKGVIGKLLSDPNNECYSWKRKNERVEEYITELINEFSYSEAEARHLNMSTMSAVAVAIYKDVSDKKRENLLAILYADSVEPDFFMDDKVNIVLRGTLGIARFLKKRYG